MTGDMQRETKELAAAIHGLVIETRSMFFRAVIAVVLVVIFLVLLAAVASAQTLTQVTGTIKMPNGQPVAGKIEFELSAPGRVADPALLLVQPRVPCAIIAGAIAAGCMLRSNDTITDPTGTYYRVRILAADGHELMKWKKYPISGATWDIGTHTPLP